MGDPEQRTCDVCASPMVRKDYCWHCPACGFWRSDLQPGAGRGIEGLEALRRKNFAALLQRLSGYIGLADQHVLEVGCAEGWFLDEAHTQVRQIEAIEPSSEYAQQAAARGHKVTTGFFPQDLPSDKRYDMIVFNDVFEHLPDPVAALEDIERRLAPGGWLILNLPSSAGLFFRLARLMRKVGLASAWDRLWQKGLPSPHITYFNQHNLRALVTGVSSLRFVEHSRLESVTATGLRARLAATHKGFVGAMVYLVLRLMLPAIHMLPSDIMVLVFQKPKSPAERL